MLRRFISKKYLKACASSIHSSSLRLRNFEVCLASAWVKHAPHQTRLFPTLKTCMFSSFHSVSLPQSLDINTQVFVAIIAIRHHHHNLWHICLREPLLVSAVVDAHTRHHHHSLRDPLFGWVAACDTLCCWLLPPPMSLHLLAVTSTAPARRRRHPSDCNFFWVIINLSF